MAKENSHESGNSLNIDIRLGSSVTVIDTMTESNWRMEGLLELTSYHGEKLGQGLKAGAKRQEVKQRSRTVAH